MNAVFSPGFKKGIVCVGGGGGGGGGRHYGKEVGEKNVRDY